MSRSSLVQNQENKAEEQWLENENMLTDRSFIERPVQVESPSIDQQAQAEDLYIGQMLSDDTQNFNEDEEQDIHELELLRRRKELLKSEVQLTRRELALERRKRDVAKSEAGQFTARISARVTLDMIAELLDYFKGNSENLLCWSKQLLALQSAYGLSDDETKILMGMRMQGRAKKWLLWNPEAIEMNIAETLEKLKNMFCYQSSKTMIRKQFDERTWKEDESFDDYFYDKIIMASRIPVDDNRELVDNIIDGIPDEILRNQAKMHCFQTPEALIQAFEQLSLSSYENRNQSKKQKNNQQTGINGQEKNRKKKSQRSK